MYAEEGVSPLPWHSLDGDYQATGAQIEHSSWRRADNREKRSGHRRTILITQSTDQRYVLRGVFRLPGMPADAKR